MNRCSRFIRNKEWDRCTWKHKGKTSTPHTPTLHVLKGGFGPPWFRQTSGMVTVCGRTTINIEIFFSSWDSSFHNLHNITLLLGPPETVRERERILPGRNVCTRLDFGTFLGFVCSSVPFPVGPGPTVVGPIPQEGCPFSTATVLWVRIQSLSWDYRNQWRSPVDLCGVPECLKV